MTSNTVQVTEDMRRDLRWFTSFVHTYNGQSSYRHPIFSDDIPRIGLLHSKAWGGGGVVGAAVCINLTYPGTYSN